ncbi:AbiV family abortive infection protein [Deinococcus kurensis]|uniref:AbiV family abortive infection protein n=1 Tax=Deinococcus kurensis TaxID=2662757 RepID=UPI0012D307E1|nr:AbiV family abortive infection protein [Deinococcus kurensis]
MAVKYEMNVDRAIGMIDDCLKNATELGTAAGLLLNQHLNAPAVSLSVIALEEIAKTILIDGTWNYRTGDGKIRRFFAESEKHSVKLEALESFRGHAIYLGAIAKQYGEPDFDNASHIDFWQNLRDDLEELLQKEFRISDLDEIKQVGFYVSLRATPRAPVPSKQISGKFAYVLMEFARQTLLIVRNAWDAARPHYPQFLNDIRACIEEGQRVSADVKERVDSIAEIIALQALKVESIAEEFLLKAPDIMIEYGEALEQRARELGMSMDNVQELLQAAQNEGKRLADSRREKQRNELNSWHWAGDLGKTE